MFLLFALVLKLFKGFKKVFQKDVLELQGTLRFKFVLGRGTAWRLLHFYRDVIK